MVKKGNKTGIYPPFIQCNINNFTPKGENRSAVLYYLSDDKGTPLTDDFLIIEIYLPNIRKKWYNLCKKEELDKLDELEKTLLIYNEKTNELSSVLYEGDDLIEKYLKEAYETSKDEEVLGLYDLEELNREKMTFIKRASFEKGKEEEKLSLARKLLKKKFSIKDIIELTDLSKEQIEDLK